MKNYIISLVGATDRRNHITKEFGEQGIDFEFFDAVTPDQVPSLAERFKINIADTDLTPGELGCFFSHVCLWQKAIDDDLDYIAVFEDDIYLGENAHLFLQDRVWLEEKGIDFIKIEMFDEIKQMSLQSIPTLDNRKIRSLLDMHLGTAGYILSNQMAKKLLAYIWSQDLLPIDNLMFGNYLFDNKSQIYQLCPALCIQNDRFGAKGDSQELKSQIQATRPKRIIDIHKEKNAFKKLSREIARPFKQLMFKIKVISKINRVGFR